MYWANFLHIYQPPTQTEAIVRKVTEECYRTLVRVLAEAPHAKITININAVLTEQLERYGFRDVIWRLKRLAERRRVPELLFEKNQLIPALQRLLVSYPTE